MPHCGIKVQALGHYQVLYRDLPSFGLPVLLIWNPDCDTRTSSEDSEAIASGTTLTKAGGEGDHPASRPGGLGQGGSEGLGVSGEVAMKPVVEFGELLVDDEDRFGEVDELGGR